MRLPRYTDTWDSFSDCKQKSCPYHSTVQRQLYHEDFKETTQTCQRTFNAGKFKLMFDPKRALCQFCADQPSTHTIFNRIYQFTCICNSRYVGRTERRMVTGISEHVQTTPSLTGPSLPPSSIAKHTFDNGHAAGVTDRHKIIYHQKNRRVLRFAEASAIRRLKSELSKQIEMVSNLSLPS